jgi:S-adenosyl-L-methionine hydrolase (adenosine-forming)
VPGYSWVSFLTDYGLADGFVAACRGVLAGIAPQVAVIDVTHLVPPGDVRRGALVLAQVVGYLPPAVHLAVVDPGVGTERRPVAVGAGRSLLVGPDNGLLPPAADTLGGVAEAHVLANRELRLPQESGTFHGRDTFAPAAAHLAAGVPLAEVGPAIDPDGLVRLPAPVIRASGRLLETEVLTVDRFGNVQLSVGAEHLSWLSGSTRLRLRTAAGDHELPLGHTFGDVAAGALVAYLDSAGHLALAVNRGDAAALLRLRPGDVVVLEPA